VVGALTLEAAKKAAEVLAEAFTSATGERNPDWDIDKPDDPVSNPYHRTRPMSERVRDSVWNVFTDTDGHASMTPASILQIVEVLDNAGLLINPSPGEVFEIYDKLSRTRLIETIFDNANDALDLLSRSNVDPRQYVVRSIKFEGGTRP
jgi:hypothetical protein